MRYGLLAENEHPVAPVTFSVPVTVTHVPAGPAEGNSFSVFILKPVAALAGAGDVTSDTERNSAEVRSSNINREPKLRLVNLRHAVMMSRARHI